MFLTLGVEWTFISPNSLNPIWASVLTKNTRNPIRKFNWILFIDCLKTAMLTCDTALHYTIMPLSLSCQDKYKPLSGWIIPFYNFQHKGSNLSSRRAECSRQFKQKCAKVEVKWASLIRRKTNRRDSRI